MKKYGSFAVISCPASGKILMGKRKDGLWCFFGGNRDGKKEVPSITVIRELDEEIGIAILSLNYADVVETEARTVWIFEIDLYETAIIKLSKEHTEYRWLSLREVMLIPATKLNAPSLLVREKLKGWYV